MEPLTQHDGLVACLDRANVDTDQIIPKQFLKRIERSGFGQFLFYDWRFDGNGQPRQDFQLNQPGFQGASVLLGRENFGCGSSREHAAWAMADYGFRVVIAPSFADIFYNNCFKNGILPVELSVDVVDRLFAKAEPGGYRLTVDLETQELRDTDGRVAQFQVDGYRREMLMKGLDDIGLSLQYADAIANYEAQRDFYQLAGSN